MSRPLPEFQFELKRLARKQERALKELTDSVLLYLSALDEAVAKRQDIPRDISTWLGRSAASLGMQNDIIRYSVLGVDFRKDNKPRVVAKIRKDRTNSARPQKISPSQPTEKAIPSSVVPSVVGDE